MYCKSRIERVQKVLFFNRFELEQCKQPTPIKVHGLRGILHVYNVHIMQQMKNYDHTHYLLKYVFNTDNFHRMYG